MHIILGALGLIVTILVLVNRLSSVGIDIGWLDPFKWNRRRKWRQAYKSNPLFDIEDPMKSTACLMYAMSKCSGDISREEKATILSLFKDVFKLSDRESADLLSICSYLVKDEDKVKNNLSNFLKPSIDNFAEEQKQSANSLIEKVAYCEGQPNEKQAEFLNQIKEAFKPKNEQFRKW
jgi:uncharacterized tellurite resistance protein B-like protein